MAKIVVGTNSWATLEQAEEYMLMRIGSTVVWREDLDEPTKEASLITAFNILMNCGLFSIGADSTSEVVKQAQCEMAIFLLHHGEDIDGRKGLQAQGVLSANILGETYDKDSLSKIPIPPIVSGLLNDCRTEHSTFISEVERDEEEDI